MMEKQFTFNILEFVFKNFFIYSLLTLMNDSMNPTKWWLFNSFTGGVIFCLVEYLIITSCIKENKEEDGN